MIGNQWGYDHSVRGECGAMNKSIDSKVVLENLAFEISSLLADNCFMHWDGSNTDNEIAKKIDQMMPFLSTGDDFDMETLVDLQLLHCIAKVMKALVCRVFNCKLWICCKKKVFQLKTNLPDPPW